MFWSNLLCPFHFQTKHEKCTGKKVIFRARALYDEFTELASPLHFLGIGYETVDYMCLLRM